MELSGSKTAGLAIALLFSNGALALGLGEASGRAVLGQPLRLEIPVSGNDGSLARTCFRVHAPRADVGNDFAARNARLEVSGTKLIVTTTAAVTEPVIGFAIEASCAGLSREYVMLVGLPAAPLAAPAVETPRAAAPAAPVAPTAPATPSPEKAAAPGDVLRIAAPVSLEGLSRQKYPLQPKAREKFVRMMMAANAGVASADAPIAAGTELRLPPGLPQRRVGPYLGETKGAPEKKAAAAEKVAAAETAQPVSAPPPAKPRQAKGGKDRLVLGAAVESNGAKLLAEAERLTNMMVEQNKAQDEMIANLAKIEADYADLHKQFVDMQKHLARIEAERAAEKQAAAETAKTQQLIELLVAVLGGGALGGAGLHLFQRQRMRRNAGAEIAAFDDEPPAASVAAASSPAVRLSSAATPAVPPWIAAKAPANETSQSRTVVAEEKIAPAAMIAAVTGSAATSIEAAQEEPTKEEIPVAVVVPAAEVVEEQPAAISEAQEPAVLPVEPPPSVVLEPLDFSPAAPTAEEKSPSPPAAAQPEPTKQEEPRAQETLTLDFPEIKLPNVEQDNALDFHK